MFKILILGVLVTMGDLIAAGPTDVSAPERAVAESSQKFAADVYQLMKGEEGNLLICPVSVQTVLALVQQGAEGETSDEISRALKLPADKNQIREGYKSLMSSFQKSEKVKMDIANRVFVKEGYKIKPAFEQVASDYFQAGIQAVNFDQNTLAAREINQWVEHKTHDKIKDLISADSIDGFTRMILVNALYFKGNWATKFEAHQTREDNFYLNNQDTTKVQMMSVTDNFRYAANEQLDCQFLELPYDGNDYAMTIVLPNKKDGLPALEEHIAEVLKPQQYSNERVHVKMPRFKVETTIKFNDILKKLNMNKPFNGDADFSGLLESKESLYISEVIQKNFINVTEEGTEAASASGVGVVTLSLPSTPPNQKKFIANHPFIYIVRKRLSQHQQQIYHSGQGQQFNKLPQPQYQPQPQYRPQPHPQPQNYIPQRPLLFPDNNQNIRTPVHQPFFPEFSPNANTNNRVKLNNVPVRYVRDLSNFSRNSIIVFVGRFSRRDY